jgi:DNA-binding LytR/AlgR family response regulator
VKINVLKISIEETPTELRWVLEGRLTGLWVTELRKSWESKQLRRTGRMCIVDLNEVVSVDGEGEELLSAMFKQGAQLIGTALYIEDLLERLKTGE